MRSFPALIGPRGQRGVATLFTALVLLAILTIVTLFGLSVGLFEQRTVGNETRARIVGQVADAGLNHGIEVVKANAFRLTLPDSSGGWGGRWQRCTSLSTGFPCGAEPDVARRSTLYFYADSNAPSAPTSLVGVGSRVATPTAVNTGTGGNSAVGAFNVDYRVGALLCLLSPAVAANPTAPKTCVPYVDNFNGLVSVTLVSRATLADEPQARADAKVTIASFRSLGNPPIVPIIAAGNINVSGGTADIVPNPNAGGAGVALSLWAGNIAKFAAGASGGSGDVKTCHLGEFLTNAQGSRGPTQFEGITRCDDCRCDGLTVEKGLISGKNVAGGSGAERLENYDILDKDGSTVLPPNTYFPDVRSGLDDPANCFDDNLFEFVFGIDTEQTGSCSPPVANAAEDFLTRSATIGQCATLSAASSGLFWRQGVGCRLPDGQVGSPSRPLFLIADCDVELRANTVFFGAIFIRRTAACPLTLEFKSAGSPVVYGSLMTEGDVDLKGSGKFVYNEAVLQALFNDPAFQRYGVVPGSWTDVLNLTEQ